MLTAKNWFQILNLCEKYVATLIPIAKQTDCFITLQWNFFKMAFISRLGVIKIFGSVAKSSLKDATPLSYNVRHSSFFKYHPETADESLGECCS